MLADLAGELAADAARGGGAGCDRVDAQSHRRDAAEGSGARRATFGLQPECALIRIVGDGFRRAARVVDCVVDAGEGIVEQAEVQNRPRSGSAAATAAS
jgi:hypothetical protein